MNVRDGVMLNHRNYFWFMSLKFENRNNTTAVLKYWQMRK